MRKSRFACVTRLGVLALVLIVSVAVAAGPYIDCAECAQWPNSTSGICDEDSDHNEVYHCVIYRFYCYCFAVLSWTHRCVHDFPEPEWTAYECVEPFGACLWEEEHSSSEELVGRCHTEILS